MTISGIELDEYADLVTTDLERRRFDPAMMVWSDEIQADSSRPTTNTGAGQRGSVSPMGGAALAGRIDFAIGNAEGCAQGQAASVPAAGDFMRLDSALAPSVGRDNCGGCTLLTELQPRGRGLSDTSTGTMQSGPDSARTGNGFASGADPAPNAFPDSPPTIAPRLSTAGSTGSESVGNDSTTPAVGGESSSPSTVRFSDLINPTQRAKVLWREAIVQAVLACEAGGVRRNTAILGVLSKPEFAGASRSSLYGWLTAYVERGLDGLVPQMMGRVGRTSFVKSIPQHLIDAAKAASVEHGTLGPRGEQNVARAVRDQLAQHPDLPAPAREHLHAEHASKSYVPETLRRVLRVSPLARAVVQGPHAAALAAPYIPSLNDTAPGRVITADDMTANVYCWCEAPTALGYIVGRPQILAWLDIGSRRWMQVRTIMRQSGGYTRDDVWGGIGDLMEAFGVWPEWLFEGGHLWRSNLVVGERTGLSEDDRFGGLRSLGCVLHHSRRPQSKPIEQSWHLLQSQSDAFPGYCGRNEREDGPELLQRVLYETKRGISHPRSVLPHLTTYAKHVVESAVALNQERQDGRALRGCSPDEAWESAHVALPKLPENATWLFRSNVARVTVRRDGYVRISQRSGKWHEEYLYQNPELLLQRSGQTLIAYWNDRNPSADCVLLTATKTPEYVGLAHYVDPISRFDATEDQMAEADRQRNAAMAFARAEVAVLKPFLQRDVSRLESLETGIAPALQRVAAAAQAAESRAELAEDRRQVVAQRVRAQGPAAADDLLTAAPRAAEMDLPGDDRGDDLLDALG